MKIQSFYTVPAICLYYEDNSELFYQIADDQDPALLELAKRAELENDCELPAGIVVVWAGETVAFRVAGSTNETEVSGCFMGTGLIVLARYLDETGQQCVMELTESEDAEHIEQLVAALNALAEPAPAQTEQREQEPFWYAVVSEQAPTINSAIKRLDVAQEFADSKREHWPDTRVVPLYAAPIAQTAPQPEQSGLRAGQVVAMCEVGHDRLERAALATRPAQTEQQPVAWRWMYNGEPDGPYAFNHPLPDDDVVWRGLMAERPRTVQPLYAAPIAQTAPQPEQSGLMEPTLGMVQAACAAFRMDVSPMEAMTEALRAALSAQGGDA